METSFMPSKIETAVCERGSEAAPVVATVLTQLTDLHLQSDTQKCDLNSLMGTIHRLQWEIQNLKDVRDRVDILFDSRITKVEAALFQRSTSDRRPPNIQQPKPRSFYNNNNSKENTSWRKQSNEQ